METIKAIVLVLSSALSLQAGTLATFDVDEKSRIEHEGGKTNTVAQYALKIFLGADVIDVEADNRISVHDYKDRKIYRTSEGKDGFIQSSLFSDIGFRVHEFRNRLFLGNAMQAANIQDNPMDRVLMEHLFSLDSKEPANLERVESKGAITFSHNGKTLFEYSRNGPAVPKETVRKFTLYVRSNFGVHPDILTEVGELNHLPERITVCRYNTVKTDEIRLDLKELQQDSARPERNLRLEIIPDYDAVFALAHQVRNMDPKAYAAACESILNRAPLMAGKGNFLDAAALFVGYGLASGQQTMPPAFFDWKEKMVADPDVQAMFSALSPKSKEDAEIAVSTFSQLAGKASDGRFSLMIFRANMLESIGRSKEAVDSFLAALGQEPAVVGAWKDLGEIYYKMYLPEQAWACWDAGRAINREHKLFEEIHQMEASLLADHPEFFMETP